MSAGLDLLSVLQSLAKARAQQGKTQTDIAQALHVTRQAVAAWECGVSLPTTERLFAWADTLGVRLGVQA